MTRLQAAEVTFHPHSFGDPDGRLFLWNEGVYRAIHHSAAAFFSSLLESELFARLASRGLIIGTQVSDLVLEGYDVVLAHNRVPFVSYPDEWSAPMLRDAAGLIVTLAQELASAGLLLKDSHPWNVLFDSTRPVYVDLTSIAPLGPAKGWIAYQEFCKYCLYPILLMVSGQDRLARLLMVEEEGVRRQDLLPYLGGRLRWRMDIRRWKAAILKAKSTIHSGFASDTRDGVAPGALIADLQELRSFLDRLNARKYHSEPANISSDHATVEKLICEKKASTLLDVSGTPDYAKLAAQSVQRVVRFDADPDASAALYLEARKFLWPI